MKLFKPSIKFYFRYLCRYLFLGLTFVSSVNAVEITDADKAWANNLFLDTQRMNWENLLEKYKESIKVPHIGDGNQYQDLLNFKPSLKVFVSSSMPLQLLRNYAQEAKKYEAVLVFKGLPNGSFKELTKLIASIADQDISSAVQIDDEAFTEFSITTVPSFVLSSNGNCMPYQNCRKRFDKITGNIGIKVALEKFAQEGDLANEARNCLAE